MTEKMNQRPVVEQQYRTSGNLSTRISIHAKYSTNPQGFNNWVFSHYTLPPDSRVLELGCGTGETWKSNLSRLDGSVRLTLTDFSESADLLKEYGGSGSTNKNFTLQNGAGILSRYFSDVQRLDYEDSLAVTAIEDLLDYMDSLGDMSPVAGIERETVRAVLKQQMVNGVLNVPKEYGMFICRK